MKGRKPLPTRLKVLAGNPGRQRLPKGEPVPEPGVCDPPEWLCPYAVEIWRRDATGLVNMGVLGQSHWAIFAAYCQAVADVRRAREALAADNERMVQITDKGAEIPSGNYRVARDRWLDVARFAAELGMTPSAGARVAAIPMSRPASKLSGLLYVEK